LVKGGELSNGAVNIVSREFMLLEKYTSFQSTLPAGIRHAEEKVEYYSL